MKNIKAKWVRCCSAGGMAVEKYEMDIIINLLTITLTEAEAGALINQISSIIDIPMRERK